MKKKVRLTESQLVSLIKKTVQKVIKENQKLTGLEIDEQEDVPTTHDSSDVAHKAGQETKTSTEKKQNGLKKQLPTDKVAPKHPSEPHADEKSKKSVPRYNPKPIG